MAISVETQKWLDDLKKEGNLTDEAYNAIKASFDNPKADEFVKGSTLRQSDYSRQMDAVRQAQKAVDDATKALEIKQDEVNSYKGTLETWKTEKEGLFTNAVKEKEAAATKLSAALNRLKTVAVANGLSEDEVLKDLDVANPNPNSQNPNPGGIDTSKFLTSDQLTAQVQQAARETALVDATIHDISYEHHKLFGTPLPSAKELVEGAIRSKMTLEDYWTKTFKVSEKRAEVAQTEIQAKIDEGVKQGMSKFLSEQALSGQHPAGIPSGANSPVFKNENIMKPVPADHQGGGGVSAAIAAHAAGKYRT